jgi:hypothetical protein
LASAGDVSARKSSIPSISSCPDPTVGDVLAASISSCPDPTVGDVLAACNNKTVRIPLYPHIFTHMREVERFRTSSNKVSSGTSAGVGVTKTAVSKGIFIGARLASTIEGNQKEIAQLFTAFRKA